MPESPYGPYVGATSFGGTTADQMFGTGGGAAAAPAPSAGALPSAGGPDSNILNLLAQMGGSVSEKEFLAALQPQAQPSPLSLPPYFTRQLPQPGQQMYDQRPVVGAGNARAQGIQNAVTGAIHGLAQFKAERDKNKQMAEATKVENYMKAQTGIDQAQQVLNDPSSTPQARQQAQDAIKQNTSLRDGMLADKNFVKTLEKGFDISLTDPSQNKTPEHGIVQKGLALFGKSRQQQQPNTPAQASQIAQRFQSQRPTMLAPNQMTMQNIQARLGFDQSRQAMMTDMLNYQGKIDEQQLKIAGDLQTEIVRGEYALSAASAKLGQEYGIREFQAQLNVIEDSLKQQVTSNNPDTMLKNLATLEDARGRVETGINSSIGTLETKIRQEIDDAKEGWEGRVQELRRQQDVLRDTLGTLNSTNNLVLGLLRQRLTGIGLSSSTPDQSGPHVGAGTGITPGGGGTSGGGTAGTGAGPGAASTGTLDPRTGKSWDSKLSASDRAIIAGRYSFPQGAARFQQLYNALSNFLEGNWGGGSR